MLGAENYSFTFTCIFISLSSSQAIKKAREAVDKAMKAAQATLRSKVEDVKAAKRRCKEIMQLKCSNCYSLKCKEAENNCKGFLDKAGKWIGGVINAAGRINLCF